jgi:hypothetical protein
MKRTNYLTFKIPGILLIMVVLCPGIRAQQLTGLSENQEVKKAFEERVTRKKTTTDGNTLSLPFFDDFSVLSVYPGQDKWIGLSPFVNASFPDMPPSIGVATLDAIDAYGDVYAIDDRTTPSDTLISRPVNLLPYKSTSKNVILSFFYQAGGKGELPDPKDSLVLEYYSPVAGDWIWIWKAIADTAGPFRKEILTVPRSFYEDGFQFRFRNYTSMSANEVKGKNGALSNVDQWHIDYVMLDTLSLADHESINDIALVDPLNDLLYVYTSIPWKHIDYANSIERNKVRYVVRNLAKTDTATNIDRTYRVKNMLTKQIYNYEVYNEDIDPDSYWIRNDPFDHSFSYEPSDYGLFEITAFLTTSPSQFLGNDTVRYRQLFQDYYAYDDGTPEFGFGISGESTTGAMTACRFNIFRKDTIRGVDIFFNHTRYNYTTDLSFKLCIWKNNGGVPGDTLFVSTHDFSPDTSAGLLSFTRYTLPSDREILVDDTIFVGIQQLSEDYLNIGYDVSHENRSNIFMNITGSWFSGVNLSHAGSLMIRPVFSRQKTASGIADTESDNDRLEVYPNPACDWLHIAAPNDIVNEGGSLSIYDITGRKTYQGNLEETVSVSHLKPGIYILKVDTKGGRLLITRFIIGR